MNQLNNLFSKNVFIIAYYFVSNVIINLELQRNSYYAFINAKKKTNVLVSLLFFNF